MMDLQEVIEIMRRKTTIPLNGESFDKISYAFDLAIEALEEIQQYRAIGTVEECREALPRRRARKPKIELDETKSFHRYYCPVCNRDFCNDSSSFFMASIFKENYCQEKDCGQAIDWSDIL